jgi:hypothetical protein
VIDTATGKIAEIKEGASNEAKELT